jgi:Lysylphosphatidylglycerol synthase TM region
LSKVFLGKVFLLSVLLQLVIVFWTYSVSQAMNISIPFLVLCISIPLINLFVLLPVSIGGLGVSEAAFVFFLVPFGLQVSEAVTMSLITVQSQTLLYLFSGSFFFGLARMGLLANQN